MPQTPPVLPPALSVPSACRAVFTPYASLAAMSSVSSALKELPGIASVVLYVGKKSQRTSWSVLSSSHLKN